MAPSPAHKLGQIIGDAFELAIRDQLAEVAAEFGLYLDYKRPREARGNKRKVAWRDIFGNSHDLDYVLEQGGKEDERGTPRAFIEIAWRRYTKHARNKVQEIQGAVLPLAETFPLCPPFKGAVLAGNFTASAREQLHAHGFEVAYCRYGVVISAFRAVGVDVASDEQTTEKELRRKIKAYEHLSNVDRHRLVEEIRRACASEVEPFIESLRTSLRRRVEQVTVMPLTGNSNRFETINAAVQFIVRYDESVSVVGLQRYELNVRYSNGDEIRCSFREKTKAIDFLRAAG